MGYAHARRVVHRDLKPANVMIGAFGELQVMDWGFAKVLGRAEGEAGAAPREVVTVRSVNGEAHSMLGSIMGTPAYMPPEQARGRVTSVDERADVFALGSILCEILTGEPVYTGTPAERLHKAIGGEVAEAHERLDATHADDPLVELALRCIATEPDERPRDAAAVADAVRTYREAVQERAEEAELERARAEALEVEAQRRAAWERRARRQSRVLALATGVAVLLALGVWTWTRARSQQRLDDAVAAAEAALDDADRAGASGNLIAALGATRRAVEQLDGQPNHPARSRAVRVEQRLLGRLEQERNERRRAAEDARIRDRLAVVPRSGAPGVDDEARRAAFDRAFAACGLDLSSLPVDSAAVWIRARGSEARDALIASLDRWALLRRGGETGGPPATRLLAVARAADVDPWRRRMRDAIETGDAGAVAALSDELRSDDDAERLSVDLAGLALDAFDQGEATVAILRRLRDRHPTSPDVQLALARRLGRGPPLARMEARRCLNAAVTIDPTLDDVWVALGDLHATQGKRDQAEATWRAGTRHGPRSDLPYLRLAAHLAATERADEALALLDGRLTELERTEPLDRETRGLALGHWLTTPELGALRDETRGARWDALWQRVRTLRDGARAGGAR